jgi:hypothetical protein
VAAGKSRVGLVLGVLAAAAVVVLAAGAGAFVLLRNRTEVASSPFESTVAAPVTTLAAAPPSTLAAANGEPTAAPSTATSPLTVPSTQHGSAAPAGERVAAGRSESSAAQRRSSPLGSEAADSAAPPGGDAALDAGFLDREPPQLDGREAGGRLADNYRNNRGSSFGTNRRFQAREKFPRNVAPAERRAVAVLLNVIHYEALHYQRTGQYGTFQEVLPRPVGAANSLEHAGYRFDLTTERDGFRVVATPRAMGLRGFVADDTGFVRFADE